MKRFLLSLILCFVGFVAYTQNDKTAIDYKNEGNEALRAKDYSKALQLYEQALGKWGNGPKDTAMTYNMAVCAYQAKDYDKAQKLLDESIAMNYKKETALQYKANIYQLTKNDASYQKALEEALAASPDNSKLKGRLATFYLKEANVYYTEGAKILKSAADDVTSGKYKTTDEAYKTAVVKASEEFKKAMPKVEKALTIDPENATGKQLKTAIEQNVK
ncbi:MAG: tetratricopeptide repeat protein [Bacteroidales bacterium]